ncbi:MAG: hypothetical protein H0W29_09250 [Gemmatimonadales bacterium]|nr:hypothetical protein [Gemmatimonadales bacterium]
MPTIKANLAYILVNRDGAAIEPGARSYRARGSGTGRWSPRRCCVWARRREIRKVLEWYAPFQYPDGKVPCCVDTRGADPVPENDSHG